MLTVTKILIFITFILPLIITSLILALINFGITGAEPYASSFSTLFNIQSSKTNPFIGDGKAGPIINGIWYTLTFAVTLLLSWTLFTSSS